MNKKILSVVFVLVMALSLGLVLTACNKTAPKNITGIEIVKTPEKLTYFIGDELDLTGLQVQVKYKKADPVVVSDVNVTGFDNTKAGAQTLTVTYSVSEKDVTYTKTAEFDITMNKIPGKVDFADGYTLDKIYDGSPVAVPTVNDYIKNGDGVVAIEWYAGETKLDAAPVNAGVYSVKISVPETASYTAAETQKNFTISQKAGTVAFASGYNPGKVYDGKAVATVADGSSYIADSRSAVRIEWYAGEMKLDAAPVNAGEYTLRFVVAADENYSEAFADMKVVVSKRPLKDVSVTREYNGTDFSMAVMSAANGLLDGDEVSVRLTASDKDASDTAKNITAIENEGADKDNYVLAQENVTFNITKKALKNVVTEDDYSPDVTVFSKTITDFGIVAEETVTIKYTFADADAGDNKEIVSVTLSGDHSKNYSLAKEDIVSKVNKIDPVIIINDSELLQSGVPVGSSLHGISSNKDELDQLVGIGSSYEVLQKYSGTKWEQAEKATALENPGTYKFHVDFEADGKNYNGASKTIEFTVYAISKTLTTADSNFSVAADTIEFFKIEVTDKALYYIHQPENGTAGVYNTEMTEIKKVDGSVDTFYLDPGTYFVKVVASKENAATSSALFAAGNSNIAATIGTQNLTEGLQAAESNVYTVSFTVPGEQIWNLTLDAAFTGVYNEGGKPSETLRPSIRIENLYSETAVEVKLLIVVPEDFDTPKIVIQQEPVTEYNVRIKDNFDADKEYYFVIDNFEQGEYDVTAVNLKSYKIVASDGANVSVSADGTFTIPAQGKYYIVIIGNGGEGKLGIL